MNKKKQTWFDGLKFAENESKEGRACGLIRYAYDETISEAKRSGILDYINYRKNVLVAL